MKLALVLLLSGCFTARYLTQAATGQVDLIARARPLSTVLKDPATEPRIQKVLQWVPDVKRFGEARGLAATGNYGRYTHLDRSAAVWVVQACEPLRFEPKRWSFPIAGTVPYLGFFSEAAARKYASELDGGLDVDVRGAAAYSTLGWFKDPVLSTMIPEGPGALGALANTVLHESVHATLYVKGQSSFDESLASFVGDRLTGEWLARRFGPASAEVRAYRDGEAHGQRWVTRMHGAYEELDALYRSAQSDEVKRVRKSEIIGTLKSDLGITRAINNATLSGYRTYDTGDDAFERLLQRCGGNVRRFMAAVRALGEDDFPSPQMEDFTPVVDALAAKECR